MKAQKTKTTESILVEFKQAVLHLQKLPADQSMQAEMLRLGSPFLDRLKSCGHPFPEAIALMRKTFDHQPPNRDHPTPQPGVYAY